MAGGLLLFTTGLVRAQDIGCTWHAEVTCQQWTVRDGLTSNHARSVAFGPQGYMWLATNGGIVRFDGAQFKTYTVTNTPVLTSNRIRRAVEGPNKSLWILTEQGHVFYREHNTFVQLRLDGPGSPMLEATSLQIEEDIVWIPTRAGLYRFYNDVLEPFMPAVLQGDVRTLHRDVNDRLWIATKDHIYYQHGDTLHAVDLPDYPPNYMGRIILFEDQQNRMWIGFPNLTYRIDNGQVERLDDGGAPLTIMDPFQEDDTGTVWFNHPHKGWGYHDGTHFRIANPDKPYSLKHILHAADGSVWKVTRVLNGEPFLGSQQADVLYRNEDPMLRLSRTISGIAQDEAGNVWVSATDQGLFRYKPVSVYTYDVFPGTGHGNVYPVHVDSAGTVWAGVWQEGVVRIGPDGSQTFQTGKHPESAELITALYMDRRGTLWVGRFDDLCMMVEGTCVELPPHIPKVQTKIVRAVMEDQKGQFWMGANVGLSRGNPYDPESDWVVYDLEPDVQEERVRVLVETRNGDILTAVSGYGIYRFLEETNQFERFNKTHGLPSNFVRDIYEDEAGVLWLAMEDFGLCRLDRQDGRSLVQADLHCLTTEDGLFSNNLHRIIEDDSGRFWINSNDGIFWVLRSNLEAFAAGTLRSVISVSYTEADGMLNREGNGGIQPAGARGADGRIWFPTQNGVVVINPTELEAAPPPTPLIESVIANGEVLQGPSVSLSADQDEVDILFTALEFTRPDDVRFRYRLGPDSPWREAGASRRVSFAQFPAGAHTFEVMAGVGGLWSRPMALSITKVPAFWETRWAYGLLVAGLMLLGYGAFRFRLRQAHALQQKLEREVAERTEDLRRANELKSHFLANISHEFRTPLTLTFGPLEDAISGRFATLQEARPHFERARRNGGRLLRLINQLLDLSRLDAGALLLHPGRHDLAALVRHLTSMFQSLAQARQMELQVDLPPGPLWHGFDADKIEKVIVNLLSNAFKFTPDGGQVSIRLRQEPDQGVRLTVTDTGVGLSEEQQRRIFDRFYQADAAQTRSAEGSGIGLSLAKEFVHLHGGSIAVRSTPGNGSQFTVLLPPSLVTDDPTALPELAGDGIPLTSTENEQSSFSVAPHPPVSATSLPGVKTDVQDRPMVLMVEDNADMRAYMHHHLTPYVDLVEAIDGQDGLDQALALVPDLILSDVMMPRMDGISLVRALKRDHRTSHIPIVLLTARADAESQLQGFEEGAEAYLPKPFHADVLAAQIQRLIAERQRLWRTLKPATTNPESTQESSDGLPARERAFLEDVERVILRELGNEQFGVDPLADVMAMSRRQLLRKVRALTGETTTDLIRRLRMERAAALLAEGMLSIKEIGDAVGMSNASSFSRAFRKVYGVAPTDFVADTRSAPAV